MNPVDDPTDPTLRDLLLGKLAPRDAEALEERLLSDEAIGQRLRAVETDLLDDVARGRLGAEDRAAAMRVVGATPKDRQRLRIATALARVLADENKSVSIPARSGNTGFQWPRRWQALAGGALAAACVALLVVGVQWHAAEPDLSGDSAAPVTITLMAGGQRGLATEAVVIPRNAETIRLQLELAGTEAPKYDLRIEDDRHTVFRAKDLTARVAGAYRFVEVTMPANRMANGAHTVTVRAASATAPEQIWSIRTQRQ